MKDETIEDQNELIELVKEAGWNVVRVEMSEREFQRHKDYETTDVTIQIVVNKEYEPEEAFANPHRVK